VNRTNLLQSNNIFDEKTIEILENFKMKELKGASKIPFQFAQQANIFLLMDQSKKMLLENNKYINENYHQIDQLLSCIDGIEQDLADGVKKKIEG